MHIKNRSMSASTVYGSDYENRASTSAERSIDEDDYAERESLFSLGNDVFDATDNSSPSSPLESSPYCETNSLSLEVDVDTSHVDEISLPFKYKNIIRSFLSNLKEKFNLNDDKIEYVINFLQ